MDHSRYRRAARFVSISPPALVAVVLLHYIPLRAEPQAARALQAVQPVVSMFEDGAPLAPGQKFVPGETVYFRFSAVDFKTSSAGRAEITGRAQVFDSRGTPTAPQDEVVVAATLRDEDKDWKPGLHFQFQIPALAPPGAYRIRFEASDGGAGQAAVGETSFRVDGRDVPASPALVVRNLKFYRSQDEQRPLGIAAYRAGDMIWVRFDVTGYKRGEQNAIDVSYDVAVADGTGKRLFAQQDAAVERNQAYYPQPWVPGLFSLTLEATMRKGTYEVEIAAHDGVGKQTATAKASFRVD